MGRFREFIKGHKKGLIIGGSITIGAIAYLGYKALSGQHSNICLTNETSSKTLHVFKRMSGLSSIKSPVDTKSKVDISAADLIDNNLSLIGNNMCDMSIVHEDVQDRVLNDGMPFHVDGHPRSLPLGRKPSVRQLEMAKEAGVELKENQTYINPYIKNRTKDLAV